MKEKEVLLAILIMLAAGILVGLGLGIHLSDESQPDIAPHLEPLEDLQPEGWTPSNYSDLWEYNWTFNSSTTLTITIENYTENQNILLDIRSNKQTLNFIENPGPFMEVRDEGGQITTRLLRTEIYENTLRQIWLIEGLEPENQYAFELWGEGVIGRWRG